jgi:hypothetical protein
VTRRAVIAEKRRLATLLLRRAKELRNPACLPFMDPERRKVRVMALTSQAEALRQDVRRLLHSKK